MGERPRFAILENRSTFYPPEWFRFTRAYVDTRGNEEVRWGYAYRGRAGDIEYFL